MDEFLFSNSATQEKYAATKYNTAVLTKRYRNHCYNRINIHTPGYLHDVHIWSLKEKKTLTLKKQMQIREHTTESNIC